MIIRTVQGRSFKGVGLYILHDKGAATAERVGFVETNNLGGTRNGNLAVAHMIDTATHANEIKRAAGVKIGKAIKTPVYHYSLSWEVNETPSKAEQIEAARESLQALGLSDKQALIVAHTDTDNPHVHVVVNCVCPETGRKADLGNDRLKLTEWAYQYRKERGELHLCPQRAANRDRRLKGEFAKAEGMSRSAWMAWKKSQTKDIWDAFGADRATATEAHKTQLDALWRQKQERVSLRRDEIKQLYKPIWRDTFKRQKKARADFDAGITTRIAFALAQPRSKLVGLMQAIMDKDGLRAALLREQEAERAKIGDQQKARIRDASREILKAWKYDRDQLKTANDHTSETAYKQAKSEVKEVWTDTPEQSLTSQKTEFDGAKDRRKPHQKTRRNSLDAFFAGDKKAIETARKAHDEEAKQRRRRSRKRKKDDNDLGFKPN